MICSTDLSAGDHLRPCSSDNLTNIVRKSDGSSPAAVSCVCNNLKSSIQKSDKCIPQNSKTNSQETSFQSSLTIELLSTGNSSNVRCCCTCGTIQSTSDERGLNHKSLHTKKLSLKSSINSIYCCTCVHDVTKHQLRELEDRLQILISDLNKEKNNNHTLKRSFLVAKKVLGNVTRQLSTENVDNLMMKSSQGYWKGQQEIILALKRKVRILYTAIERLEIESNRQGRKRFLPQIQIRRPFSKNIPNKENESWYLELEREEILRNEERFHKNLISSKDSMKDALEIQSKRNKELVNEIYVLREKLYSTEKNAEEFLPNYLREIEKKMRNCLEEKTEDRWKLDSLKKTIFLNSKAVLDLKEKIDTERKIATAKKATLMFLKKNGASSCMLSLELHEIKCKQALMTRKLDEMLKDYSKIVARGEMIFTPTADGRILLRKLNTMQKQNTTNKDEGKKYRMLKAITEEKCVIPTVHFKKVNMAKNVNVYKIKYAKYQEKFKHFESQNLLKFKGLQETLSKTNEDLLILLRNRDSLLKVETDINVLKNRKKKISKVVNQLPKKKLVRKKNSCPQLTEILEAGRIHFNILKLESKFLRILIKRISASKGDDQELLESFFRRNKDVLLKCS